MTENEVLIKTPEEAIETIKSNMPTSGYQMLRESLEMAITALKEIQQYREIGTVEECREAVEKQNSCDLISRKAAYEAFSVYLNKNFLGEISAQSELSIGEIASVIKSIPTASDKMDAMEEVMGEFEIPKETQERIKEMNGKDDASKPILSRVPPEIIRAIEKVREYGCQKYPEDSWKDVETQRYWEAVLRHTLEAWKDYGAVDPESGLPHIWHIACNLAFIISQEGVDNGLDRENYRRD